MLKKIALVFGIFVLILLAALVIIPFAVDVDQYRPQIEMAVNQRLNGKLELGTLKLSLWGQVRVDVAGVTLTDAQNRKILSVADSFFHVPFGSILNGSPVVVLKMNQAAVNVAKDKQGKINLMSLMKGDGAAPDPAAPKPVTPDPLSGPVAIPGIIARARVGIELRDALLTYRDETTGVDSQTRDLNFLVENLSLSRPMEIKSWATLDSKVGNSMTVRGPIRLEATVTPRLSVGKSEFEGATAKAKLEARDLAILMPGVFEKKAGIPAHLTLTMGVTKERIELEQAGFVFHNAQVTADGSVQNLVSTPVITLDIASNEIDLKPWNELIPMLKEYELTGTAKLTGHADGPSTQLQYRGSLKIDALTAKAPKLKTKPRFDALISIVTDQIDNLTLTMKAPGNDLLVRGRVVSFTQPQATLEVTSNSLDLDQLIEFPKKGEGARTEAEAQPAAAKDSVKPAPASDYDAMFASARKNKTLDVATASITANLKLIKAYDIAMTDVNSKMTYRNLAAAIDSFSMKLWDGQVNANAVVMLRPEKPTYQFGAKMTDVNLKRAVESQLNLFKNTVLGIASFSMDGSGASFNPDPAIANLKVKGNMKVQKATFASIDVGKMTSDALNAAIQRIAAKYPQIKDKKVGIPAGRETRYEMISSDFTIADGKFMAPNFMAKAEPRQGVDLSGNTSVGIKDYALDTKWQVVDTYNITQASNLDVQIAGTNVEHILGNPVSFPVSVGCNLAKPCYTYTEVPEYLAGIAFKNITQAAEGRAKAELQKKAESLIQQAPPGIQNPLDKLKKKLFK